MQIHCIVVFHVRIPPLSASNWYDSPVPTNFNRARLKAFLRRNSAQDERVTISRLLQFMPSSAQSRCLPPPRRMPRRSDVHRESKPIPREQLDESRSVAADSLNACCCALGGRLRHARLRARATPE